MLIAVLASAMTAATLMATAFGLYEEARKAVCTQKRIARTGFGRRPASRQFAQPIGAGTARHAHSALPGHVRLAGRNPALSGSVRGVGAFMALLSLANACRPEVCSGSAATTCIKTKT